MKLLLTFYFTAISLFSNDVTIYKTKVIRQMVQNFSTRKVEFIPLGKDVVLIYDKYFKSYRISYTNAKLAKENLNLYYVQEDAKGMSVYGFIMKDDNDVLYKVSENLEKEGRLRIIPVEQPDDWKGKLELSIVLSDLKPQQR